MLALILLSFFATSISADQTPKSDDFLIVPGIRVGAITPTSSEADLRKSYPGHVSSAQVDVGEGEMEPGAILFADDPTRKLEVVWKDGKNKRNPERVQITGTRPGGAPSRWKTAEGITLGSTLKEIQRINGRPFKLVGFAFDYSGTAMSWQGGRLEKLTTKTGRVLFRMEPDQWDVVSAKERDEVSGDKEHSSAEAAMQKLNPRVYQIVVVFR